MQNNVSKNFHMKFSNGMLIDPLQLQKPIIKAKQVKNWHFHHTSIFRSDSNQNVGYETLYEHVSPFQQCCIEPNSHIIVGERAVKLYTFPQRLQSGSSNPKLNLEPIEISDEEGGWNDASQLYKMKISYLLN